MVYNVPLNSLFVHFICFITDKILNSNNAVMGGISFHRSIFVRQSVVGNCPLSVGAFDILVYTDKDLEVPDTWGESGPGFISNSEEVKFRSISTKIHKVDTMVAFKSDR